MKMEYCKENFTNDIPNVTQQIEALGDWVYAGYIGVCTSLLLFAFYMYNVFVNIIKMKPVFTRRYNAWITSLPMAVSFLSLPSFFVPRAAVMCEAIKFAYMPFILMMFVEVTLQIGGGEETILNELRGEKWQLFRPTLPILGSLECCKFAVNKKSLRVISALVYQAFIGPFLLTIVLAILESAKVQQRDHYDWKFWMINFLNLVYVASFSAGSWALFVLVTGINSHLESKWPKFMLKYYVLIIFVALQKAQNLVFNLLTFVNIMVTVDWKTIDSASSMIEAGISGFFYYSAFREGVDNGGESTGDLAAAQPFIPPTTANNELHNSEL